MQKSYLCIETHPDHPNMVRIVMRETRPRGGETASSAAHEPTLRYAARFNDGEAALMHTHENLRRRLVDIDSHLYRVPLNQAIAAAETVSLRHQRAYLDPDLDQSSLGEIEAYSNRYRLLKRRKDLFFETMGYIGIGLLLFNLFAFSVA
ncbi:hypothetical protein [Thiosocius teredinicola]|uniref:hypothetical protein n=1 Tax=Thiosocius teredinicola TaxID=1973002 RepID=UPI000990E2DB